MSQLMSASFTAQQMKFSIKDFFIFCAVLDCVTQNQHIVQISYHSDLDFSQE